MSLDCGQTSLLSHIPYPLRRMFLTTGDTESTENRIIDDMVKKDSKILVAGEYFKREKPDYVLLAAAKVGGIMANNTYPADFIYVNLVIQNNIIHQSFVHEAKESMEDQVVVWGTGTPRREFLHVDDLADVFAISGAKVFGI